MKQNKIQSPTKILSNYLSSNVILEIGLNPEQEIFPNSKKERKFEFPAPSERIPQKIIPLNTYSEMEPIAPIPKTNELTILSCFEVQMQNKNVFAFSIYVKQCKHNCGVVIQDGKYLRYGKIIREVHQNECPSSTSQIVQFDENNILGDYIEKQSETMRNLSATFIREKKLELVINEIEMVSYSSRAMFRIKVEEADKPEWNELIRFLISIFSIAIEIYE